jgi:hypothetical protein
VHRELYDFMLRGEEEKPAQEYSKPASNRFAEIQPEISQHTNFFMAVASLRAAVGEVGRLLEA